MKIDKILIEGLFFVLAFAIYQIYSDKEFLYKYFWRTYFYLMIYAFPLTVFITLLPYQQGTFPILVNWALIIFFSLLIIFNLIWINATETEWYKHCTSKLLGLVFTLSLAVMLIIAFIVKLIK